RTRLKAWGTWWTPWPPRGRPNFVAALLKVNSITSIGRSHRLGQIRSLAHISRGGHQRRHAAHAIKSDDRNRSAAEGIGLAGCIGQNMAFLQRSELAREAPRTEPRG